MITFVTIAGGAALTGGNFWQGAVTGLVVSGLNHALHPEDGSPVKKEVKTIKKEASGIDEISKIINSLGLGTDAKMAILSLAKGDLTAIGGYLNGMKVLGKLIGVGAIGVAA